MPDRSAVDRLARTVGAFHVTDKKLRAAQARLEAILAAPGEPDAGEVRAYVGAVRRYFEPYAREAHGQLAHVDRELARLYQLQFNLTAERGVVQKRIDATGDVLHSLEAFES